MGSKDFKAEQKVSIATNNSIARDNIKGMFQKAINSARKEAMFKLRSDRKLGPGLNARILKRDIEDSNKLKKLENQRNNAMPTARGY